MTSQTEPTNSQPPGPGIAVGNGPGRHLSALLLVSPLVALAVVFCNYYLDTRIATEIQRLSRQYRSISSILAGIPDTLLAFVLLVTASGLFGYFFRTRKGINDRMTLFFKHAACLASASYIIKVISKYIFGRIETRIWLYRHSLYGFRWFHGGGYFDGFPSGHMLVFTALAAAIWRFFPRFRKITLSFIFMLALALIAGNYHFLGDVIAGAYLGLVTEEIIFRIVAALSKPVPATVTSLGEDETAGRESR